MRSSSIAPRSHLALALMAVSALVLSGFIDSGSSAWAQGSGDDAKPKEEGKAAGPATTTTPDDKGDAAKKDDAAKSDGGAAGEPDPAAGTPTTGDTGTATTGTPSALDPNAAPPSPAPETNDMPVNLRLRRLEQRVQALKERAWRAKARVGMLKEAVLGGGVGATASVLHRNKMGSSFRLIKLVYALDGTQVFARADDTGALHKSKQFEVLTGPIAPGSHTLSVLAIYRGHGYGVFKYLTKYKFTVRSSHTFTATEGKATRIEAVAFEKGTLTTPLEDRPAIDFKVSHAKGPGGK